MAGAYCHYCGRRCFLLRVIPDGPMKGKSLHLATCQRGMELDRDTAGYDHETAINPVTDPEAAALTTPQGRLRLIADLLPVCPEPGIACGNDMCICGSGEVWPCGITKAAWIAAGLTPDAEIRKVLDAAKREMDAEMAAYEAMRDVCRRHGGIGVSGPPCPVCEEEDEAAVRTEP